MKINDQLRFSHPVLSADTSDLGEFTLGINITVSEIPETSALSLICKLETGHPDFRRALDEGYISCFANIICLDTFYNQFHPLTPTETTVTVPPGLLRGRAQVRAIAVATKDLDISSWQYVHEEFNNISCLITKNSVVGLSEEFPIDVGLDKLRSLESIFRLVRQDSIAEGQIAVDIDTQYIRISAPPALYSTIHALRNLPTTRDVLLNSVYLSAVLEVLALVKSEPTGFEDKWWFRVFRARCTRLGIDLEDNDLLKSAQQLLGSPLAKLRTLQEHLE